MDRLSARLADLHLMHSDHILTKLHLQSAYFLWHPHSIEPEVIDEHLWTGIVSVGFSGIPNRAGCLMHAGWQLTEVDDPYQQTASLARQAQAKQLAQSAGAEAASGGDPDAISHASDSTHAQQRPGSHTQQANTTASHPNSSRASRDASPRNPIWAVLVSVWLFINRLLGGFIGKVMYALNDRLASTDPPAWALKGISALASGPMKHTILKMYSEAGDHSRRLSSVKANAKFSSVQAGPDEPWQVVSCYAVLGYAVFCCPVPC